jgi:DNA repair exonuclease SbcCD nuclease subunit
MKSVLVTDTHLGFKNSMKKWLDLTVLLFKEICDYCISNNLKSIIHLGDFFDNRYSLNVLTIKTALNIIDLLKENGIHIYIIKGNHDQYYKNDLTTHSLIVFNEHDNVTIIDTPFESTHEVLSPWGIVPKSDKKILLGHYEVNGGLMNESGNLMQNGSLNVSDFKEFDKVYSGHFHSNSKNGNIHYIGSAFAFNFGDVNATRGYYHYEDGKIVKFIEFKDAPKFQLVKSDSVFDERITNNICKLVFTESLTQAKSNEIVEAVKAFNPLELYVDFDVKEEYNENEAPFIGTNEEVLFHYIENVYQLKSGLNKNTLKKTIASLIGD